MAARRRLTGQRPDPGDDLRVRLQLRRRSLGTFAFVARRRTASPSSGRAAPTSDAAGVARSRRGRRPRARRGVDLRTATRHDDVPVRVLTETVTSSIGRSFIQVIQDRTTEQRTLDAMLRVLLVGGARRRRSSPFGFGAVYARRALVPIRDSLAAQRLGPAPPARVRRRRQPRAADAADRHPELASSTSAATRTSRSATVGDGARRHRRRGRPPDGARRGPAAARPLRFRRDRPRRACRVDLGDVAADGAVVAGQAGRREATSASSSTRSRRWSRATRPGSASS